MRFNEINSHVHLVEQDGKLQELSFHGSQCTKDCSGHRAGYKWSLDRGGVENPASPSQSFINGANIGVRMLNRRPQGGGRVPGYASQTQNAIRKREQRLAAKSAPATGPIPVQAESRIIDPEFVDVYIKKDRHSQHRIVIAKHIKAKFLDMVLNGLVKKFSNVRHTDFIVVPSEGEEHPYGRRLSEHGPGTPVGSREFLREYSREATARTLGARLYAAIKKDVRANQMVVKHNYDEQQAIDYALQEIEKRDPTTTKTYTPWMARVFSNGGVRIEDLNFNNLVGIYDQAKRRNQLAAEHKDINRFKTWADFSAMMEPYLQQTAVTSTVSNNERARGEYKRIIQAADGQVIQLLDKTACIYYGQNTKWCTAATESENMADQYLDYGDVYVFIPSQPKYAGEKYQVMIAGVYEGYDSDEVMDQQNQEVSLNHLHKSMPDTVKQFVHKFPESMRLIHGDMFTLVYNLLKKTVPMMAKGPGRILNLFLSGNHGQSTLDDVVHHTEGIWDSNGGAVVLPEDFPEFVSDCMVGVGNFMTELIESVMVNPEMFGIDPDEVDVDDFAGDFQEYLDDNIEDLLDRAIRKYPVVWNDSQWAWQLR